MTSAPNISLDTFDLECLGKKVIKIDESDLTNDSWEKIQEFYSQNGVQQIILSLSESRENLSFAQENGFNFLTSKTSLSKKIAEGETPDYVDNQDEEIIISSLSKNKKDPKDFFKVAHVVSERSRYALDSTLNNEEWKNVYEKWVENALSGFVQEIIIATHFKTDEIVGFLFIRDKEQNESEISLLSVTPGYQRRGIGTRLIRFAEERLNTRGASKVSITTEASNIPALNLYQELGYKTEKNQHIFVKNI